MQDTKYTKIIKVLGYLMLFSNLFDFVFYDSSKSIIENAINLSFSIGLGLLAGMSLLKRWKIAPLIYLIFLILSLLVTSLITLAPDLPWYKTLAYITGALLTWSTYIFMFVNKENSRKYFSKDTLFTSKAPIIVLIIVVLISASIGGLIKKFMPSETEKQTLMKELKFEGDADPVALAKCSEKLARKIEDSATREELCRCIVLNLNIDFKQKIQTSKLVQRYVIVSQTCLTALEDRQKNN